MAKLSKFRKEEMKALARVLTEDKPLLVTAVFKCGSNASPPLDEKYRAFIRNKCFLCGLTVVHDNGMVQHIATIHRGYKLCKTCNNGHRDLKFHLLEIAQLVAVYMVCHGMTRERALSSLGISEAPVVVDSSEDEGAVADDEEAVSSVEGAGVEDGEADFAFEGGAVGEAVVDVIELGEDGAS